MADILTFAGFRKRQGAKAAPEDALGSALDGKTFCADLYASEPHEAFSAGIFSGVALPEEAFSGGALSAGRPGSLAAGGLQGGRDARFGPLPVGVGCDWTNQELADLYRVEALLVQANIRIETTRGVSDEGDPWFVFCHADGEVFVHLARIDGLYILDGPGLDTVLSGPSFAALIDRFAGAVASRTPAGNIVQFRPGRTDSVVRLHPAVMLAALVWSLYLASDHLVGSAQAGELDSNDGAGHAALFPSLAGPETDMPPEASSAHAQADKAPARLDADAAGRHKAPTDELHRLVAREAELSRAGAAADGASWNMAGTAASIAAGLTAIAISFGLYDAKFAENASHAKLASGEAPLTVSDPVHAASLQQDFASADRGLAESKDAIAAREVAAHAEPTAVTLSASDHAQDVSVQLTAEVKIEETAQSTAAGKTTLPHPIEKSVVVAEAHASGSQQATVAKAPAADDAKDLQALLSFASEHLGQVSSYKMAGLSVDATFDVSTLNKQMAQLVLADLAGTQAGAGKAPASGGVQMPDGMPHADVIAQYLPGDAAAKTFVYQFLLKLSHSVEMIQSGNTVIFVDTTAIDDPDDHAYSVSWVWDDHTIVSTIGHAQDFAGLPLA